jgi:t-SNARE complex subunit (syntaxin)
LALKYCGRALREGGEWEMEMNARVTKIQAAENDLKQLMADVARAVEKAQEAVARITPKAAATTTETEFTTSAR